METGDIWKWVWITGWMTSEAGWEAGRHMEVGVDEWVSGWMTFEAGWKQVCI